MLLPGANYYHREMSVFGFIVALVVLGPLAKALADRISRGGPTAASEAELRKSLRATEQRLADTETRLATVEERLDFYEKLLANPKSN
ncbi:MAG: hypothetical protein WEE89_11680 [Gemmatimonadota bacterium]